MNADLKKILKAVVLEMRHELEGYYDIAGKWHPGDLETRLAEIGVRKDRASVPVDELGRLIDEDVRARKIVDAFIDVREQAGVDRAEAVAEYVRESAYTWANRLVALRCMEARELLDDEVIVGREAYGGRSLVHHRLAQSFPELCTGEDDGRFAMLAQVFAERSKTLPMLFDPDSASIALRPSPAALKNCLAWLSGTQKARSQEPATDAVFAAPDALGWAYQYWNTEEKNRVFETVRTKKGAKIEGADIIPATQLYTEDYMVKFLVQNSLGATWMGMHPESRLFEGWEYYVRDADRAPVKTKPLQQITLLDPACGSGHFLLDAFDMFYTMYEEEGLLKDPEAICRSILENNLFGIDIDERAIQIAEASLWMKAEERSFGFTGANTNLVAATSSHLKGESWERFLTTFEKEPHIPRVLQEFARSIEHIDELGSLARPYEALEEIIKAEHEIWEVQERERHKCGNLLFQELRDDLLATQLPFQDISDIEFFERTMRHARLAIDTFSSDAREAGEFNDQMVGAEAKAGFRIVNFLSRTYDIVVANPPYMGNKNMGANLRFFVDSEYKLAPHDLYTVFILRSLELCNYSGRVSIVAPQTWMFLSTYSDLRCSKDDANKSRSTGVLVRGSLETLAQLGRHAFSEADPPSNVAMVVIANAATREESNCIAFRLTQSLPAAEQSTRLLRAIAGDLEDQRFVFRQSKLQQIPLSPVCYWLSDNLLSLFSTDKYLRNVAECVVACKTSKNSRFLRQWWEVSQIGGRWRLYEKESIGVRFRSSPITCIDWSKAAQCFYSSHYSAQLPNPDYRFRTCIVTSKIKRPNVTARLLSEDALADMAVNQVFVDVSEETLLRPLCALLNSRLAVYLMRLLNPTVNCQPADFYRLPLAHLLDSETEKTILTDLWSRGDSAIRSELSHSPIRSEFRFLQPLGSPQTLSDIANSRLRDLKSARNAFENAMASLDAHVNAKLRMDESDLAAIEFDISEPGLSDDGDSVEDDSETVEESQILDFEHVVKSTLSSVILFNLGWSWRINELASSDLDGIILITPFPMTSALIERLNASGIHDQAIDGEAIGTWIETEFFRFHTREFRKRPIAWHMQSSSFSAQKVPVFACLIRYHCINEDTIPKIRSQYVSPLRRRFETELRGIFSMLLSDRTDRHTKRAVELEEAIRELQAFDEQLASIARSGFGPTRLLPTLRQYAFDDAILSMKACWLQRLSVLLKQSHGEQAANGVRNPSPLDDWQDQANKSELHQDLPAWIAEALSQLSYFCSQVGPKAPDAKRIHEDPSNADFGSLIQAEIASTQIGSMKLACGVWWGKFDAAVLAPIRERIKTLKAEQKELNAAIKEDRQPVMVAEQILEGSAEDGVSEVTLVANDMLLFGNDPSFEQTTELTKAAMTARLKEVKAKIKKFTEEMDSKAGKAQAIRDTIQAWQLPEPLPALLDFSPSSPNLPPLFDQVSSLDERRSPPKTIAEFIAQESLYAPDINDGVRVNIAPLQKAGVLAADVLAPKDVDKAIADRAEWRADERRWVREGKLPQPGWWKVGKDDGGGMTVEETDGSSAPTDGVACKQFVSDGKEDK